MAWATPADVRAATGKTVTPEDIAAATSAIELVTGLIEGANRELTPRDAYWLKLAVSYQAAWMQSAPDYFDRNEVSAASSEDQSATGQHNDWIILAPLTRRAIKRLSWRGTRTVHPKTLSDARVGKIDPLSDASDDIIGGWKPL